VTIDWALAPVGMGKGEIVIKQEGDGGPAATRIAVQALRPAPEVAMAGFVENSGVVAMEAEHASATRGAHGVSWQKLPGFGETLSGMEAFPVTAESTVDPKDAACLDYDFYLWDAGNRRLESVLAPTMQFVPGRGLRFSVGVDAQPPTVVDAWATNTPAEWEKSVSDGVHKIWLPLGELGAGQHRLHVCRVDAGVVLERLMITRERQPNSYLGPLESALAPTDTASGSRNSASQAGVR
jgi:Gylcosyl hydrolase family 115 C-terminal domain